MTTHLDLLVLCTYHPLTEAQLARLRELAAETTEWLEFESLAALNKVEPKVVLALRQAEALDLVPSSIRQRLEVVAAQVSTANEQRLERARVVLEAVQQQQIPVAVLKGVLFGETLYGAAGYKRMNDVDFLVPRADIQRLPALFESLGYFSMAERVGKRPEVQTRVSHHLPPYVSRDLRCVLGAQWGLKSPLLRLNIDYAAMWSRTRAFDFKGLALRQLSPADNLFHLCIHLGFFKAGLRDVMDLYNLAHATNDLDWALFTRLVIDAGAFDQAFHALSLAHRLRPLPAFARALEAFEPHVSPFMRDAVTKKTGDLSVLLRLCSGYLSVIEKAIADFNSSHSAPEKLRGYARFWKLVLDPPAEEVRRMCFEPRATPAEQRMLRLRAPVRVLRAIGAEIGTPLLGLLLAKGSLDAVSTALNPLAWRRAEQRGLEAFATRHGLSVADVQRLHDSIF